jgi:sugar lactone lactonase YvrE
MKWCSLPRFWCGSVSVAILGVILWVIPSPIDPPRNIKLSEKRPSFVGPLEPNTILSKGQHIFEGEVIGPESFAIDRENVVYTGLGDGRVVRLANGAVENITSLGNGGYGHLCGDPTRRQKCGRPLAMEFQPNGKLYVVDSFHGLYSIDVKSYEAELVWNMSDDVMGGNRVAFPNSFAVLDNGSILVSDSSERCSRMSFVLSFVEFRPEGKVVLFNPSIKETHVIMHSLTFPNGLLLSKDGSFVYLAETGRARILRRRTEHNTSL